MRSFMHKFIKYDADFEYGAELPEIFLRWDNRTPREEITWSSHDMQRMAWLEELASLSFQACD